MTNIQKGEEVVFVTSDEYGLWKEGDGATYLGKESDHPDAPNIQMFDLRGETISLHAAFERELVILKNPWENIDLAEFTSDYWRAMREAGSKKPKARDIAEAYIEANSKIFLSEERYKEEVEKITPQVEYYLP